MSVQLTMSNAVRLPRPAKQEHISICLDLQNGPRLFTLEDSTEKHKKSQFYQADIQRMDDPESVLILGRTSQLTLLKY